MRGIVPGGGLAPDGKTWVACRLGVSLPVRVLSRLFRRRFIDRLQHLHRTRPLQFFGGHFESAMTERLLKFSISVLEGFN